MIYGLNIPGSYAILLLQHRTLLLSLGTSKTVFFLFVCLFLLWLHPFILSGVISSLIPVAYWAPIDLGSSSWVSYHFAFSYCSWGSQGKNTEVVYHSLVQWTTFCQTSPPWLVCLPWPHTTWLSFFELDKAVVGVIRLASFLWLWFQCVCHLRPSCNTYHLNLGFSCLGHGVYLHSCSSKVQPLLLTLDESPFLTLNME